MGGEICPFLDKGLFNYKYRNNSVMNRDIGKKVRNQYMIYIIKGTLNGIIEKYTIFFDF